MLTSKPLTVQFRLLAIMLLLFASHSVQAASFDCAKAQTKVEKLICADAELSKLDEELAKAYTTALQDKKQIDAIRDAQKLWLRERNGCADADCVKLAYINRLAKLKVATALPVKRGKGAIVEPNDSKSSATQVECNSEDLRSQPSLHVKDILGMYRQSVDGLPANAYPSDEKRTGYNYLAISFVDGNLLRVRLATKEINGHDCGFDSRALLCGRVIRLIPNDEERSALESSKQSVPSLKVTADHIAFSTNPDGTVTSGSPYCGVMGYLRHSFSRKTRSEQIDETPFTQ